MLFGFSESDLEDAKAIFTAAEIAQQPDTWEKTIAQIASMRGELDAFVASVTDESDYDIILTGAGTSEYVGNTLAPALYQKLDGVHSFGTTDIVATPEAYISATRPTLIVSFARSGNSPESVGAVKAAERVSSNVKHLFITCNAEGALAKMAAEKDNCFSIVLTPETHDQSFAMTSSFTNMYIAALLALAGDVDFTQTIRMGREMIEEDYQDFLELIYNNDFERVVYLGSDVLKGIAQESALKMLELTAGRCVALHDTPMGFRHGPKSVIDDNTLTVVYMSENPWTRRYEMDVLAELDRDKKGGQLIAVGPTEQLVAGATGKPAADGTADDLLDNCQLAPAYIIAGQMLGLFSSLKLGITPDNPCPTGEVNRVVQGVTIYE